MAEFNVPDPLLSRPLFSSSPESVRYPGFSPISFRMGKDPLPPYKDIWCSGFSAPNSWPCSPLSKRSPSLLKEIPHRNSSPTPIMPKYEEGIGPIYCNRLAGIRKWAQTQCKWRIKW